MSMQIQKIDSPVDWLKDEPSRVVSVERLQEA